MVFFVRFAGLICTESEISELVEQSPLAGFEWQAYYAYQFQGKSSCDTLSQCQRHLNPILLPFLNESTNPAAYVNDYCGPNRKTAPGKYEARFSDPGSANVQFIEVYVTGGIKTVFIMAIRDIQPEEVIPKTIIVI